MPEVCGIVKALAHLLARRAVGDTLQREEAGILHGPAGLWEADAEANRHEISLDCFGLSIYRYGAPVHVLTISGTNKASLLFELVGTWLKSPEFSLYCVFLDSQISVFLTFLTDARCFFAATM
jgi:hypothetical protein